MKTKTQISKQILSLVLALVMVLSMLPVTGLTAFAADTDTGKAIALGTSVIADGDKANNKWDYVYYGTYDNNPIKWRVLSKNGNDGTYKDNDGNSVTAPIFLLSEYTLKSIPFGSTTGGKPNEWQSSHAQAWCKREIAVKSFSNAEKKYVLKTTKDDAAQNLFGHAWGASTLQDDQVFFISAKEALDYLRSNESLKANTYYWLRSPYASNFAGFVGTTGEVHYYSANNSLGARPAFNLDPSSVLFTSAAVGGKPDGFNSVGDYSGDEWKLTLLDESRSEFNAEILKTSTKTVVSYSDAVTGKNEYISALIQDADGNVTYYGRLKNVANTADASGTAEIDLSGKMNSGDKLYIFNEQYNGDKMTDLAGELCEVTIPSEVNAYAVTFDANGGQINSGGLQCYKKGVKTTLPTDVEKTGYTFDGWYKNEDLTGSPVKEISETDTGNKTYYAKWIYRRKIVLGTSVIADGNKANNKWDYVYYGTWLYDPIKWRVLSKNGNGGTYKDSDGNSVTAPIFLLSEYMLGGFYFERTMVDDGDGQINFNEWQNSDAQAYCREIFENTIFEDAEKKYVLKTTKNDAAETLYGRAWGTSELKDDTGFLISAREASDYLGSDNGDKGLITEDYWCLRSPYQIGYVCSVNPSGIIDWFPAQSSFDARPAFNLDPSSVLFTSAAEGGKSDGFNSVGDYSGDEWKLTLKDDSRSGFSASVTSAVRTSAKVHRVTLSYSGAATDFKEYISAMICDAKGNVTYYGRLRQVVNTFDEKGTVELDLSGVTMSATDTLYIFNEQYNGDKMTDYASELKAVTIPSGINAYEVTFDADGGTGAMNSAGVKSGETYTLPACTFTAPTGYEFEAWSVGGEEKAVGDSITVTANTTVTAVWERTAQSITVSAVAGTKITISGNQYHYIWTATEEENTGTFDNLKFGQTYTVSATVPTGYEAFGTTLSVGSDGIITFEGATLGDDGVYQLNLTKIDYTITFNSNDGSAVPSQTVAHNDKVTKPDDPTQEGFTFSGWYSDMGLSEKYDFDTPVTGNMTLYAGWSIRYYTVAFESNGGGAVESQSLGYNSYASEPFELSRAGYSFVGWFTDEALTTEYSFNTPVTKDMTLYAKWEILPADAPAVTSSENLTLTYKDYTNKQVSVTMTEPKEGYTYSYQWYDASTDQPISDALNATYAVPNGLAAGNYFYYCVVTAKRDDNGETASSQSAAIKVVVNKATLTADDFNFEKPANLVFHYSGNKHATVTPKDGVTGIGAITVQYVKENGQTASFAYNAGTYTVTIAVEEGSNYFAADGLTAEGWTFTITKGEQDAPTGLAGVAETICGKNDGKITGVYYEMEYRNVDETDADYKSIEGDEITGLAAGTYYVRMKETNNLFASEPVPVTITAGRMLTVTVPSAAEQIGYAIEAPISCAYGDTVEIKITALEGYGRDENFDIYNNGASVSSKYNSATGILTLENVTEDVSITLASGSFVDRTKPTAEITLGTNKWNSFWNGLTFGLFFKETQTVTITADDKGSGLYKVYYYISEQEMERIDVNFIADDKWQEYTGAFNIDPDRVAVIYVKAVDNAGNFWLVNSDGLVFDATAPTLEGIENGKTYYGDLTVIKPNEQFGDIDQVTLDGETMSFVDGTYGRIPADNKEHTVVVTDKAGNKTEYKVTVYKNYTVTYKVDGETYSTQTVGYGKDATPPTIPDKEGYTQTAPTWDQDGKNIIADTVINAVYTVNSYTITLDHPTYDSGILVNHGMSFNEMYPDIDANVNLAAEKDYHTFTGWYESTDGGETLKDTPYDFNADVTGDVTLYPMFKIYTYTVTYKADGQVIGTVTVEHGADATAPAIPEKEGHTQTAPVWDKDGKNITADTEINAVYTINEYTVTFMDENGVYKTVTVKHGEKVTMPEPPKKDGYTVKWETTIDKATGNATVKAVYTEIPATGKPSSPQTGDTTNLWLWVALLFVSGGAVITLTVYDRKRRKGVSSK